MKCNSPFDGSVNDRAIIAVNCSGGTAIQCETLDTDSAWVTCEREAGHDGQHQRTISGGEAYVYWVNHDEAKKGTETP